MASMESLILTNLKTRLDELTWVNSVEFEKIKLISTDFREHELPAIQFYDSGKTVIKHEHQRVSLEWQVTIELVMKTMADDVVNQGVLLDRIEEIERKIGANVQLDLGTVGSSVGQMVHVKYLNAITDLHTLPPFFSAVMNFSVAYYKPFTGVC